VGDDLVAKESTVAFLASVFVLQLGNTIQIRVRLSHCVAAHLKVGVRKRWVVE